MSALNNEARIVTDWYRNNLLLAGRDKFQAIFIAPRTKDTLGTRVTVDHEEAVWPSGQWVELAIRWSQVRVPLWPLAGFVLGRPELKSSATLVNSQLVASCQLGFLTLLCYV